jgi:hypothetical protein
MTMVPPERSTTRKSGSETLEPQKIQWTCPGFVDRLTLSVLRVSHDDDEALWKLVETVLWFPRSLWTRSVRPQLRQLPQGAPTVAASAAGPGDATARPYQGLRERRS